MLVTCQQDPPHPTLSLPKVQIYACSLLTVLLTYNRWLKASGISIACEEKMREIAQQISGRDELKGEIAPFSFALPSGGEELRETPHIFMLDLIKKVTELLEQNYR